MGNNGYGRDTILLRQMILQRKTLPILSIDDWITQKIKRKLNIIVEDDILEKKVWNKYKYLHHSAWSRVTPTVTVINKLRQQNWFWEYFKL